MTRKLAALAALMLFAVPLLAQDAPEADPQERDAALALPRALATGDPAKARALLDGLDVDYVEVAPFDPPTLAAAVRAGSVRLIDNVPLQGDTP